MESKLNPLNNTLPSAIADIYTKLNALNRARQPYISDWKENTQPVVYVSSSVMAFSDTTIDARSLLNVGDVIRYKQAGSYKYAFVTLVSSTQFTINGGSDYTLVNATITDFAKSLAGTTATGFPGSLNFDCNPTAIVGSLTINPNPLIGVKKASFFMIGNFVFVDMAVNGASLANVTNVRVAVPILQNIAAFQVADRVLHDGVDNFTSALSMAKLDQTSNPQLTLYLYPSFGAFSVTTNGFGFYIKYSYRLDPF